MWPAGTSRRCWPASTKPQGLLPYTEHAKNRHRHLGSQTRHPLEFCDIPRPVHRELRSGMIDLAQVFGCQLQADRSDVLIQALELARAGNRDYPRLFRKQPCKSYLAGGHLPSARELAEQLNHGSIGSARFRGEARDNVAGVIPVECRVLVDLAGEKPIAQGAE